MKTKFQFLMGSLLFFTFAMSPVHSRWYDQETLTKGTEVFQNNCASCHKANAEGTLEWKKKDAQGKLPPPPLNGTAHAWHHGLDVLKTRYGRVV